LICHFEALGGADTGRMAMFAALAEGITAAPGLHLPAIDLHLRLGNVWFVQSVGITNQYSILNLVRTQVYRD